MSEHQPTAWPSFFFDLNILIWLFPAGVFLCFRELREEHVFIIIYSLVGSYFAGVMVRLMLTLTPVVCLSAAMTIGKMFDTYLDPVVPSGKGAGPAKDAAAAAKQLIEEDSAVPDAPLASATISKAASKTGKSSADGYTAPLAKSTAATASKSGLHGIDLRMIIIGVFTSFLGLFVLHCTWVTSNAYSSPSVVLASRNPDGSQNIIDDFREAYYWIRQNTAEDAKIMSWWDYGELAPTSASASSALR